MKGEKEKGNRETLDLNLYRHYKTEIEFVLVEVVEEPAPVAVLAEPPSEVETGVTEVAAVLEVSSEVRERVEEEMGL